MTLKSLMEKSVIVVDTADIELIKEFEAQDATMNPSLLLSAIKLPQYKHLVKEAITKAKETKTTDKEQFIDEIYDWLAVLFGKEILKLVPGFVSTEINARYSFDTEKSIAKAKKLIEMYKSCGVSKEHVLIKLATTWESCEAAKHLELSESIHCNMTLLFSFCQALIAAEARATLISPFVGRIQDWFKLKYPNESFEKEKDPGVQKVKEIFYYYKKFKYLTTVMGASFRSTDQILQLAGIDKLTISPKLLDQLKTMTSDVTLALDCKKNESVYAQKIILTQPEFRWMLNQDQMATEKLSEGIRVFHEDELKLKSLISELL